MSASGPHAHARSLGEMDYSILQQCMHCGMCLPTCPTYDETKLERHSPRGRIALMRSIADGQLGVTDEFAEEMYYCLGCLACETACPAGVNYAELFEVARAEIERKQVLSRPERNFWRWLAVKTIFMHPRLLRLVGRLIRIYQASGTQFLFRKLGAPRLLPKNLRDLEPMTPQICAKFSHQLIRPEEKPAGEPRYRVALLTGCVQDLAFAGVNRDTADVLLQNGCTVVAPPLQPCCGSLHAHNGETELAADLARRMIDLFPPAEFDAIISNAGGCGSHLRHYSALLADDPQYGKLAALWDARLRDIHEWLVEIGFRAPRAAPAAQTIRLTYHESCHLTHGQKIFRQPRQILQSLPGVEFVELPESNWCCGSAGIYNITQPEMAGKLQERKIGHIGSTACDHVATSNPGCHLQLITGLYGAGSAVQVTQPVSLLAAAYRNE